MSIETKGRSELKSYFVKNAIPTEANFASLIDAPLNQADDGVFKLGSEPLSVVAAPGERKPTLRLYDSYPKQAPNWTISLAPTQDPGNPATARDGLGIVDGQGNTRLFVDQQTGALGLGVNAPQGAMEVLVPGAVASWNRFVVAGSTDWGNGNAHVTIGTGTGGIMLRNPHVSWQSGENRASIRYGLSGGTGGGKYWDVGIRADSKFTCSFHAADAHKLTLDGSGNLAVTGTVTAGGAIYAGNSDIYFTNVNHDHTGIGNAVGFAAIENSKAHNALMLLGRKTSEGPRRVRLWDYLEVNGDLDVKGDLTFNNKISTPGRMHIDGGEICYILNKSGVRISKSWGGTGDALIEGDLTVNGAATTGTFRARSNGGVVNIEGSNHAYIQWYPMGSGAGRKAWIGYGSASTTTMTINSDAGPLALNGSGGVTVGSLLTSSNGAVLGSMCFGGQEYGSLNWPYETIQLQTNHNLRVCFGTVQKFVFGNNGTFTASGAKSFVIPHPLDPERRELVHAAIEGPEAAVYYRGEAELVDGSCEVTLPAYFEKLVRAEGRTVQLTPKYLGKVNSTLAATEIRDGTFAVHMIHGDNTGQAFYWEVKAARADIDPLEVERAKV